MATRITTEVHNNLSFFVLQNSKDDADIDELVECHIIELRDLIAKDQSPALAKSLTLRKCTISPEYLNLLQTLPKLRMLLLENCTITSSENELQVSAKYGHFGKKEGSAPIMEIVTEHEPSEIPQALSESSELDPQALLKPEVTWVNLAGLQKYIWEYIKHNLNMSPYHHHPRTANRALARILEFLLIQERSIPFELTKENIDALPDLIYCATQYFVSQTFPPRFIPKIEPIEPPSGGFDPRTVDDLVRLSDQLSLYPMQVKLWEGFK